MQYLFVGVIHTYNMKIKEIDDMLSSISSCIGFSVS